MAEVKRSGDIEQIIHAMQEAISVLIEMHNLRVGVIGEPNAVCSSKSEPGDGMGGDGMGGVIGDAKRIANILLGDVKYVREDLAAMAKSLA